MDYIRTFFIGVGYKQFQGDPPSTKHFFAEVVIIANSHQSLNPLLYLLKKETIESYDLVQEPKELIAINSDAFAMAGEVHSIDKRKKIVYLSNNQSIAYNYLILATGTDQVCISSHPDGLMNGLQILIHALRVRKISPNFASAKSDLSGAKNPRFMSFDPTATTLPPEIKNLIFRDNDSEASFNVNIKRLYEVII